MLTPRFSQSVEFARAKHQGQIRKGTEIPYLSHVLAVSALVLEHGGGEDEAIAAMLHDTVEDCGGPPVLEEIRSGFGDHIAAMVEALSDASPQPGEEKPPWRQRKVAYLEHLDSAAEDVLLVSACDKLHNARAIEADVRKMGLPVFERFKGGIEGTLWYYRALADSFDRLGPPSVAQELKGAVQALEWACGTTD